MGLASAIEISKVAATCAVLICKLLVLLIERA